jgi:calcineurin-like phosphoesterase family protein
MVYIRYPLNFGHRNIIKYQNRPFMSEEEKTALENAETRDEIKAVRISNETLKLHDDTMIDNINGMVMSNDTLYHLGDFCMGGYEDYERYRKRINCKNVYLIKGNHDTKDKRIRNLFVKIRDLYKVKWNGEKIILCHYPMLRWDCGHYGAWHLYGHCHGGLAPFLSDHDLDTKLLSMDVGVDCNNYAPVSFETVKKIMEYKDFTPIS